MKSLAMTMATSCCLLFVCAPTKGQNHTWKTFTSRGGWTIQYPADWRIGSCQSCPDPHAPGVFVDFFPPSNRADGWVMVEPLQRRPASSSVDAWLAETAAEANQNPHLNEQKLTVAGQPALRVRYQSPNGEMEEVFVVSGNETFSITFDSEANRAPLEALRNYATFNEMVNSFGFHHR